MKSTDYRNLTILSHLGDNLEPGLTLTSVTSFTVSWKDVAIHMRHVEVPRSQVMYALNANIVGLCEGDITKVGVQYHYLAHTVHLFFEPASLKLIQRAISLHLDKSAQLTE